MSQQETQDTFASPMNTYEEVLNQYESYRENPSYYDNDNIFMYTTNMFSPYGGLFEGSLGSAENMGSQIDPNLKQMKPMSDGLYNPGHYIGDGLRRDMEKEMSNIFIEPTSIENLMNVQREREKIVMIPTPRVVNRDLWTIKDILAKTDVNPVAGRLVLPKSSFEPYLKEHLSKEDFERLVSKETGIMVNVYDHDTETTHKLWLALRGNYHLRRGWGKDFIERKKLREGQEIGLFWDSFEYRFHFSVISLANTRQEPRESPQEPSQIGVGLRPDDMELVMPNISIDELATLLADSTEYSKLPYDDLHVFGMQWEGYDTNTAGAGPFEHNSNIPFGSFGSIGTDHMIGSVMNAQREREKIEMIPTPRTPQWTIKKKLTPYDVKTNGGTLVLPDSSFHEHIRMHLPDEDLQTLARKTGITVDVYDYDLGTMHKLRLALRNKFVLTDGWLEDFVRRRGLRERDEIGLVWDSSASMFLFGVISRYKGLARKKNS